MSDIYGRNQNTRLDELIKKTLYQSTALDKTNFNGALTVNDQDLNEKIRKVEDELNKLKIEVKNLDKKGIKTDTP